MAGRTTGYTVNLVSVDRTKHLESVYLPAGDVILLHNRLWMEDRWGNTRVLEATDDSQVWDAVPVRLPPVADNGKPVSPVAGAEVRTVLRVKYETRDSDGRVIWKETEVEPSPSPAPPGGDEDDGVLWSSLSSSGGLSSRDSVASSEFVLGTPELDADGRTVWTALPHERVPSPYPPKTIRVLFQTQNSKGITTAEHLQDVNTQDIGYTWDIGAAPDTADGITVGGDYPRKEWVKDDEEKTYQLNSVSKLSGAYIATRMA
jgi:hypothetical protein